MFELLGVLVSLVIGLVLLFLFRARQNTCEREQREQLNLLRATIEQLYADQRLRFLQQPVQNPAHIQVRTVTPALSALLASKHLNSEWLTNAGQKAIMHEDDEDDEDLPYRFFVLETGKIFWTDANGCRDGVQIIVEEWVEPKIIPAPANIKRGEPTIFLNNISLPELPDADENPTDPESKNES